jgi:GT2 family glycosyltransferase
MMNGEWAGVGGRVFPKWNRPPAQWLSLEQWYALGPLPNFDFGPIARELTRAPFGANMAYQKRMFEKYGGFRTDLGRGPDGLMSDEDTEFGSRLLAAGEKLRYEPSAIVYHPVSDDRTRKEYFLSWWFHKGKASIRQFGVQQGTKHLIWGVPLYLVRRLTVWSLKWAFAIGHTQRLSNKLRVWSIAGEISECCRHSVVGKKQTIAR